MKKLNFTKYLEGADSASEGIRRSIAEKNDVPVIKESVFRRRSGSFLIILKPSTKSSMGGRALRVVLHEKESVIIRHLARKMLFKGISTLEFFILLRAIENTKSLSDEVNGCLLWTMSQVTETRKRSESWTSQYRPLRKLLLKYRPVESLAGVCNDLLEYVMSELRLPQQGMKKDDLYSIHEHWIPPYGEPVPERYIGVGYKDHGTLGSGQVREATLDYEEYSPSLNARQSSLIRKWKKFLKENFEE